MGKKWRRDWVIKSSLVFVFWNFKEILYKQLRMEFYKHEWSFKVWGNQWPVCDKTHLADDPFSYEVTVLGTVYSASLSLSDMCLCAVYTCMTASVWVCVCLCAEFDPSQLGLRILWLCLLTLELQVGLCANCEFIYTLKTRTWVFLFVCFILFCLHGKHFYCWATSQPNVCSKRNISRK